MADTKAARGLNLAKVRAQAVGLEMATMDRKLTAVEAHNTANTLRDLYDEIDNMKAKADESMPFAYLKCERCGGRVRTACEVCPGCARLEEIGQCQQCIELRAEIKRLRERDVGLLKMLEEVEIGLRYDRD